MYSYASEEAQIRARVDALVEAIRSRDLEGVASVPIDVEQGRALVDLEP